MLIYLPVGQPFSVRQLQIRRIAQGRRLPISTAVSHHSVAAVNISETALRRNTGGCHGRRRILHNIPQAPAAVLRARAAISAVRDLQYSISVKKFIDFPVSRRDVTYLTLPGRLLTFFYSGGVVILGNSKDVIKFRRSTANY